MLKRYREYGLALLLLAGSGLLALVLLAEWAHYRGKQSGLKRRLAEKVEVRLQAPPAQAADYALPDLESYAQTVERPLFMEGRRPAEADASLPDTPVAEKTPLGVKLMGVVFTPGADGDCAAPDAAACVKAFIEQCAEKTAKTCDPKAKGAAATRVGLLVDAKGKPKRLGQCGQIDGWRLARVLPAGVIMEQDGKCEELKLFVPKPKNKQTQPAVPGQAGQMPGPLPGQSVPPFGAPPNPFAAAGNPAGQAGEPQPFVPSVPADEIPVPPEEPPNE